VDALKVRSSTTNSPGDPSKVMLAISDPLNDRKSAVPVVPSVFAAPTTEPKDVALSSKAVRVSRSKLVYHSPTVLCGAAKLMVTKKSTGSQTAMDPEWAKKAVFPVKSNPVTSASKPTPV